MLILKKSSLTHTFKKLKRYFLKHNFINVVILKSSIGEFSFFYTEMFPHKSQGLPTGNRNDPRNNQTSSNISLVESWKTADLLVDNDQSNSIPTSQTESFSCLDCTDQNQDEEYLSADIQNISLNAGNST